MITPFRTNVFKWIDQKPFKQEPDDLIKNFIRTLFSIDQLINKILSGMSVFIAIILCTFKGYVIGSTGLIIQ
jgi:hypothetical protein